LKASSLPEHPLRSSYVLVMGVTKNSEVEVSERQGRAPRARIPGLWYELSSPPRYAVEPGVSLEGDF
jgi:hypothetical protein